MFEVYGKLLGSALGIWEHKEKNKYRDQWTSIMREYREEYNKDDGFRSDARLDELKFELYQLGDAFNSTVEQKNA